MIQLRLALLILYLVTCYFTNVCEAKYNYDCIKPIIQINVAPVSKKLQVAWEIEKRLFQIEDWIGLYEGNTDTNIPNQNLKYIFNIDKEKGWETSNLTFDGIIEKNFEAPVTLKWRAIYWRSHADGRSEALVTTKLSTYPNWMEYYWETLKNKQLISIFIPGTHDSVCDETIALQLNPGLKKVDSFKRALSTVKQVGLQTVGSISPGNKLTMTQDMDIMEQLLLGIRYLDIRVILADNGEYWTGHGGIKVIKLDAVIDQVKEFAEKTQKELIIFDFHQVIDFHNEKDHEDFAKYLRNKFTDDNEAMWIPTVNTAWRTHLEQLVTPKTKIILSYNDRHRATKYGKGMLWYPVKQLWGNTDDISTLLTFFQNTFTKNKQPNNICHAAMAQLTAQIKSVQEVVDTVNFPLNEQAQANADKIYDLFMTKEVGLKTNILATDYFMGMGTVRQAFIWNGRKFQEDKTKLHCDPTESYDDQYYQHNIIE